MAATGPIVVVTDTSVLVNFLCIDRMDLIARHSHRFVITDHVTDEITDHYPEQKTRLAAALAGGIIEQVSVTTGIALDLFKSLSESARLGKGESAAIAYAIANEHALGIDDRRATNEARRLKSHFEILSTARIMIELIRSGVLDAIEADRIKNRWEQHHRFRLGFASFTDLL